MTKIAAMIHRIVVTPPPQAFAAIKNSMCRALPFRDGRGLPRDGPSYAFEDGSGGSRPLDVPISWGASTLGVGGCGGRAADVGAETAGRGDGRIRTCEGVFPPSTLSV